jgi:hypothetical protein
VKRIPRAQTMRDEMKGRPRAALRVCAGERRFAVNSFRCQPVGAASPVASSAIESELTTVGMNVQF